MVIFAYKFPPDTWEIISIFLLIFLLSSFLLSLYLLNNVRRAILLSLSLIILLSLRALGLREPVYIVLLVLSLISLEVLFTKH